jgi:AcrR family transcriptional regulator
MAYRETEKTRAQAEAKRNLIVASAIDVIAKVGMEGFTTDMVAARAGVAAGLLYKYFPDKAELLAAVFAHLLARDLAALRERTSAEKDPLNALAAAIAVFYTRLNWLHLVRAAMAAPIYEKGIRDEFERLIRAAVDASPKEVKWAARVTLGAIVGMTEAHGRDEERASMAVLFALRGIGVPNATARKVVARMYGTSVVSA